MPYRDATDEQTEHGIAALEALGGRRRSQSSDTTVYPEHSHAYSLTVQGDSVRFEHFNCPLAVALAILPILDEDRTPGPLRLSDLRACSVCGAAITQAQAGLSCQRRDGALPACQTCVTVELTRAREQAEHEADDPHCTCNACIASHAARLGEEPPDEAYERAAARARNNDFAETGGKDWT